MSNANSARWPRLPRPSNGRRRSLRVEPLEGRWNPAGALDLTFGGDGKLTTSIGQSNDYGYAVALQPDGKIVSAGYAANGSNDDFAVTRYYADGIRDSAFGGDGIVTFGVGSGTDQAFAVALQNDGKIVIAGAAHNGTNNDFAIVRLNADGSLDTSFDGDGKVTTTFGNADDFARGVAVQPDGRIVAAGYTWNGSDFDFAVARYNTNGSLDTSFDGDGRVTTDILNLDQQAFGVALQDDGKIVVAGYSASGSSWDFALTRYNTDGSLDNSFDSDGRVSTAVGSANDVAYTLALQADGKIIAAGYSSNGSNADLAVVRYLNDGKLDTTFDSDGKTTTTFGSLDDVANSVAVQTDGKIVAGGYMLNGTNADLAVARFDANGALDSTFDGDGKLTGAIGSADDVIRGLAVQADGKIVATGQTYTGSNFDFALVRFHADGRLDRLADGAGKFTAGIGSGVDGSYDVAVQADGKIVVAGVSNNGSNYDFAVARFNTDGSFDASFDGDGKVTTAIGSGDDYAYSVALQADGKIVVAGYSHNGSNNDFAVVRYNSDGSPDTSFDGDGLLITPIGSGNDVAYSVALQTDGKIVAAGYSNNGSNDDFAVARYNVNGSLDTSFDSDGKLTTAIGSQADDAWGVAVQPDGKIVVVGYSIGAGSEYFMAVARYNANGSPDNSFDTDGKLTTDIGTSNDYGQSVAIQADGKIVVGGYAFNTVGVNADFALVRYNSNGTLDTSFDIDGKVMTPVTSASDFGTAVAIQPDGKILVAGNGSTTDFAAVRYDFDGSLDTTFDGDGKFMTPVGNSGVAVFGMALQADGMIVLAGSSIVNNFDFAIARLRGDNRPPVPLPASFNLDEDASIAVTTANYYYDPDHDTATTALLDGPAHGTASLNPYGQFTYTPFANFYGTDRFSYSLTDSFGGSSAGSVTLLVNSINDSPTLFDDAYLPAIVQGSINPLGKKVSGLYAGLFADPDGDMSGVAVVGNSADTVNEGSWQYSTDNGTSWFIVGTVADDATALGLSASTRLRFLPDVDFAGQPTPLVVRAIDDTFAGPFTVAATRELVDSSANGGTTAISATTALIETTILPTGGGAGGNTPPTLSNVPLSITVDEGDTITFTATASDPDAGQTPAFSLVGAPPGASIDPDTGEFTWVTTSADGPGTYAFKVAVTDGIATANETVFVIVNEPTNNPPSLSNVPTLVTVNAGNTIAFTATASDPDAGQTLVFNLAGAPSGASIDPGTGEFSWTTTANDGPGTYAFNVQVTDGVVTIEKTVVVVVITASNNSAPSLTNVPVSAHIVEGDTLAFTASASDADLGQTLTFSLDSAPAGATIDPDTGAFSWTTDESHGPGMFVFNVDVTDGLATTSKTVTVMVGELNTAPVLAGVPASNTLHRGQTWTFAATATDADVLNGLGNTLTFSLVGAPADASIHPDTGVFTWTPADTLSPGTYTFDVRVADDGVPSLSDRATVSVSVQDAFLQAGNLMVGGTAGNDTITVNPSKDGTQLFVTMNKALIGAVLQADVTGQIIVHGLGGNDKISVSTKITKRALLFGEVGNDSLTGGGGANVLVGGDGNDKLTGGKVRDVLLGGKGSDMLKGGAGDDLLVGGKTDFDVDLTGLTNLLAEWTSASSYTDRVDHVTDAPAGLNGTTFLNPTTIDDDAVKDVLTGAGGQDWFVASNLDKFATTPDEQRLTV